MNCRPICAALAVPFAAALLALAPVASACSVTNTYRVPTNLELAGQADAIVKATVLGENAAGDSLEIAVVEVVKADGSAELAPGMTLMIVGVGLVPDDDKRGWGLLSNPYQFVEAHPLSYMGACVRTMFPKGTTALFFLEGDQARGWQAGGGPFSRWAEDVVGDEDEPWMVLTRSYVAASEMPEEEGRAALEAMQRRFAMVDDPVMNLMAADVARQLEGPNTPWNQQMYEMMGAAEEAAADAVSDLLMEELEGEEMEAMAEAMEVEEGEDGYSISATVELPDSEESAEPEAED